MNAPYAGKHWFFHKQSRSRLSKLVKWTVITTSDSDDEEQTEAPIQKRDTVKGKGKLLRSQTARQHAAAKAKLLAPVQCQSSMTEAEDFELAHLVLKIRWQECNESHDNKLTKASIDTKPKSPITKNQLVKNLIRKMNAFTKILHNLPR